ncbi:MAG: molybdenum cofactor biosynthesis protein MoaE [Rhizobiales bacterium]|nr:molybdenum cofactor biosynthesis protein MoaE [Hyphomicrobiales bacterium]
MISVQQEDFDVAAEIAALGGADGEIGAIVSFTGIVRGDDGLLAMTLEHYPGMTEKALEDIEAKAHARWPLKASRIIHRTGRLEPGDNIVLVITASAHRQAAFEAASFLMDYLKTEAPFWKLEERPEGTRWVEAREADDAARSRWEKRAAE